jgi:propanediol dehydratase large subunit
MKKILINNHDKIFNRVMISCTGIGAGIGMYNGYVESRNEVYYECICKTSLTSVFGAYCGLLGGITLPITLPIVCFVSIIHFVDTKLK